MAFKKVPAKKKTKRKKSRKTSKAYSGKKRGASKKADEILPPRGTEKSGGTETPDDAVLPAPLEENSEPIQEIGSPCELETTTPNQEESSNGSTDLTIIV